ncbi:MAG TPA: hypothetical protein VMR66_11225 [Gemmatimonadota bacterium]|nr:hypothetical protein [Gemmatimonadota bacterium]
MRALVFPYALATLAVSAPCAAQERSDAWVGPDKPVHADRWTQGERFSFKDLAARAAGLAAFVALSAAADR